MRTKIYILGLACLLLISCGEDFRSRPPTAPVVVLEPNIIFFTANPTTIKLGEKSTLSWEVHDCTSVEIDVGIGKVDPTDLIEVSPSETTYYTLTAFNQVPEYEGQVYVGRSATKTSTVTVEK